MKKIVLQYSAERNVSGLDFSSNSRTPRSCEDEEFNRPPLIANLSLGAARFAPFRDLIRPCRSDGTETELCRNRLVKVVRAEGLEPSRGLRPNGFSYPLRSLRRPAGDRRPKGRAPPGLWSGLYLHRDRSVFRRSAVGAARLVSTPSPPEFSVGAWLGIAISQGSPNLSSSASPVSRRALKLRLSPMRLPIPPRPRGQLKYKAKSRCEVPSLLPWPPSSCA